MLGVELSKIGSFYLSVKVAYLQQNDAPSWESDEGFLKYSSGGEVRQLEQGPRQMLRSSRTLRGVFKP